MRSKVDPRTGIAIHGRNSNRPTRFGPSSDKKNIVVNPQPIIVNGLNPEELKNMARDIGVEIGKAMAEIIKGTDGFTFQPTSQIRSYPRGIIQEVSVEHNQPLIQINESLVDVGMGVVEELQKGEGSATLAKTETAKDESLQASKNKLRAALKRGS